VEPTGASGPSGRESSPTVTGGVDTGVGDPSPLSLYGPVTGVLRRTDGAPRAPAGRARRGICGEEMQVPARAAPVDTRPKWAQDDELVDMAHRLTAADRALIEAGPRAAVLSGGAAGLLLGFGPWAVTLLLRALLGGGWGFDHWTYNLTYYAILSLVIGFAMGGLRRWSNIGHRFGTVPVANVRAGWNTWLGLVAVDALIIVFGLEDQLGPLLLITLFGLVWIGLLYDLVWTAVQNAIVRVGLFR